MFVAGTQATFTSHVLGQVAKPLCFVGFDLVFGRATVAVEGVEEERVVAAERAKRLTSGLSRAWLGWRANLEVVRLYFPVRIRHGQRTGGGLVFWLIADWLYATDQVRMLRGTVESGF